MAVKPADNNGGNPPPQKPDITELVSRGDVCLKPSDEPETGPTTSFMDKVARLLKKCADTRPHTRVAFFSDHNEAYYHWKVSQKRGDISRHSVLIHVDAHADMGTFKLSLPPPPEDSASIEEFRSYALTTLNIGNFIPPAVFEGLVDEIYWVLPDWINYNKMRNPVSFYLFTPGDITYYVGKQDDKIYFSPAPPKTMEGIRTIVVHKTHKENLPDFKKEKRDVILDLDLDWADNSGLGDEIGVPSPGTTADATSRIRSLTKTLNEKHIKPKVVTIAGSPDFTRTHGTDDLATSALSEFTKSGLVETAEVALGRYSPSINTINLATSIADFLIDNMSRDPRLLGDKRLSVEDFNTQLVMTSINSVPEDGLSGFTASLWIYYQLQRENDNIPPNENFEKHFNFVHRRDDLHKFIELCDEYGLLNLSDALKQLAALQQKPSTTRSELFKAYVEVLELTKPLSSRVTLHYLTTFIPIVEQALRN